MAFENPPASAIYDRTRNLADIVFSNLHGSRKRHYSKNNSWHFLPISAEIQAKCCQFFVFVVIKNLSNATRSKLSTCFIGGRYFHSKASPGISRKRVEEIGGEI